MNLRNKELEESLRGKICALETPAWKQLRPRRYWLHRNLGQHWIFRLLAIAGIGGWLTMWYSGTNSLLALIVLLAMGSTFWRASQLLIALVSSARLKVFAFLPLSDAQVFDLQFAWFLKNSLWSLLDFAIVYAVLAGDVGYGGDLLLAAVALGAMQYLVTIAVAVCLVAYLPRRRFEWLPALAFLPLIAFIFSGSYSKAIAQWLAVAAHWIPPIGWILFSTGVARSQGLIGDLAGSFATAIMMLLFPLTWRRLRNRYRLPAFAPEQAAKELEGSLQAESFDTVEKYELLHGRIRRREFLRGSSEGKWIERFIFRWLTPEERIAAEFLSAGKPAWERVTSKTILILACVVAASFCFPGFQNVVPVISVYILAYVGQTLVAGSWPGITTRKVGGSEMPMHCVYPVGFWTIVRAMTKANVVCLLVLSPVLWIAFYLIGTSNGFGNSTAVAVLVLKGICALFCLLPIVSVMALSTGTNDSSSLRLLGYFLASIVMLGGCGVAFFLTSGIVPAAFLMLILALLSLGASWFYGRAFNHNWFDLQKVSQDRRNAVSQASR
jgi:hypothetical protein